MTYAAIALVAAIFLAGGAATTHYATSSDLKKHESESASKFEYLVAADQFTRQVMAQDLRDKATELRIKAKYAKSKEEREDLKQQADLYDRKADRVEKGK